MADFRSIGEIVIVGGGTAGWITANLIKTRMPKRRVTLIESPLVPRIGVGEALTPFFYNFLRTLQYDPIGFVKDVEGSIKLAVRFENWLGTNEVYYHPFQDGGEYYAKPEFAVSPGYNRLISYALARELSFHELTTSYSLLSDHNKVPWFSDFRQNKDEYHGYGAYAYHMDTAKFAETFSALAKKKGVHHIQGDVVSVEKDPQTGFVGHLLLEDGRQIRGDFFVDCSGFKRLLISTMGPEWESYRTWLPVNAAIPFHLEYSSSDSGPEPVPPYTLARALSSGWLWRIPLRHRYSGGYVYCDAYCDEEGARREIAEALQQDAVFNVGKKLSFEPGTFGRIWIKNCVAVGLASGFIEPLESTSIQLTLTQVLGLIDVLKGQFSFDPTLLEIYNRSIKQETDDIRDFIILHYATTRSDTPFWQYVRNNLDELNYPDSVRERLEVAQFRSLGHNRVQSEQIRGRAFGELSSLYVMQSLGLLNPEIGRADLLEEFSTIEEAYSQLEPVVARLQQAIADFKNQCVSHRQFLNLL